MVREAPRLFVEGRVELDWVRRPRQGQMEWYVGAVPLDSPDTQGIRVGGRWIAGRHVLRPGNFLRRYGFDITMPAQALSSGTLISWLVLWSNNRQPRALGHGAVVLAGPQARPEIATLQTLSDSELSAELDLVSALLHDTAEAGFTSLIAPTFRPSLPRAGFTQHPDSTWTIALDDPTHLDW